MKKVIACSILALTAAGCGEATQPANTTTGAARPATAPSLARALLQHRTRRPPGVSMQFDYVGGAGPGPCLAPDGPPRVQVFANPFSSDPFRPDGEVRDNGHVTFGQAVDVCFNGFGSGPVDVQIDEAGQRKVVGVLHRLPASDGNEAGWAAYDWVPAIDASWPLGHYTVSARSGSGRASTSFEVLAPHETGLRILGPSTDPGHNEIARHSFAKVFLAGFRGADTVQFVVYRLSGWAGKATYFSSARVPVPSSGNTIVTLATGDPSPQTTYIVTVRSGRYTLYGSFNVMRPISDPSLIVGPLPSS